MRAPYGNIVTVHAALWSSPGQVEVVDPGMGDLAFMTRAPGEASDGVPGSLRNRVAAITVDTVMRDFGIHRIDRMKPGCERSLRSSTMDLDTQSRQGKCIFLCRGHRIARRNR